MIEIGKDVINAIVAILMAVFGAVTYFFVSQELQDRRLSKNIDDKVKNLSDDIYEDLGNINKKVDENMECVKKDIIVVGKKAERVDERLNFGGKQIDSLNNNLSDTMRVVTALDTRVNNLESQNKEIVRIQQDQSKVLSVIQQDVASTNVAVSYIKSAIEKMSR